MYIAVHVLMYFALLETSSFYAFDTENGGCIKLLCITRVYDDTRVWRLQHALDPDAMQQVM